MNNKIIGVCSFLAGAAIGAVVTWKLVKTKYEKISQEEIEDVKEAFSKKKTLTADSKDDQTEKTVVVGEKKNYEEVITAMKYNTSGCDNKTATSNNGIQIIDPCSVGEIDDYRVCTLTYYADGVLADEVDDVVENVDDWVGSDSLKRFGEYEDDAVHVRNDRLKVDFEILLDNRKFSDVVPNKSRFVKEDNEDEDKE